MRKKELIAKPAVTLPRNLSCKNSVIVTGKPVKTSCGTVLETDVYYRNELVARHFTGKLGYWNYDPVGESWDGCSLDGLCGFHSGYTGWKYPSAETEAYKEAVRKYYKSTGDKEAKIISLLLETEFANIIELRFVRKSVVFQRTRNAKTESRHI